MKKILTLFFSMLLLAGLGHAQSYMMYDNNMPIELSGKSLAGTEITTQTGSYIPGGTDVELEFTISVVSPDGEWAVYAELDFPEGVTVTGATNMDHPGTARILNYNGETGDGATITWGTGTTATYLANGNVVPFTVTVDIDAEFDGNMQIEWFVEGDEWGAQPHTVSGTISIAPLSENDAAAVAVNMSPFTGTHIEAAVFGTVFNNGAAANSFNSEITIVNDMDEVVFTATENVTLNPAESALIDFGSWTPEEEGNYTATLETLLAGDENPDNNVASLEIEVTDHLLWGYNIDYTGSTSGIISSNYGALEDGLLQTADDFMIPEGTWFITSINPRGWQSAGSLTGYIVHIYEDNDGMPGDLVFDQFVETTVTGTPELTFTDPLILEGGHYWLTVAGHYPEASAIAQGRWNWYTWNKVTLEEAMIKDNPDLFGEGTDWAKLSELGIEGAGSTDFSVWGTNDPVIMPETAEYILDEPGDIATTLYWVSAQEIVSIHDGTETLTEDTDYTLEAIDGYSSILNFTDSYLTKVSQKIIR